MICTVNHTTAYTYDGLVFLEPQAIRLFPRVESYESLLECHLKVTPEPAGSSVNMEIDGSVSRLVWFNQETKFFSIDMRMTLELAQKNPFDYIIYPDFCQSLPMQYPSDMYTELSPYYSSAASIAAVVDFSYSILKESKGDTIIFLSTLTRRIKEEFLYETRESGEPYSPAKTLLLKKGSCRDLAVLFIEVTRAVGMASRFVSGYYFDPLSEQLQLHAWAETYIPGAGWRGFDPTIGLACFGHHIPLATGACASMATPIKGSFRGEAKFVMTTKIQVEYQSEIFRPH